MKTPKIPFSQLLKERRKALGLTQAECAKRLDVSKRAIEQWEAGTSIPLLVTQDGIFLRLK